LAYADARGDFLPAPREGAIVLLKKNKRELTVRRAVSATMEQFYINGGFNGR